MNRSVCRGGVVLATLAALLTAGVGQAEAEAEEGPPQMIARLGDQNNGRVGPDTDAVPADAVLHGSRSWISSLDNRSTSPVTPTISIDSGYAPQQFCSLYLENDTCSPLASFPRVSTGPELPAEQESETAPLSSSVPTTFSPGFDSSRAMNPLAIPPGGATQTVSITLKAANPAIWSFSVFFGSPVAGATFGDGIRPDNLNQGEAFTWDPAGSAILTNVRTGKTYRFTATIAVPNQLTRPVTFRPHVNIYAELDGPPACEACLGESVTVPDPTLDGPAPGRGAVTFSATGGTYAWWSYRRTQLVVLYVGEANPEPTFLFGGFFRPIDNPPAVNTMEGGRSIPVKFSLGGNQGLNILATDSPSSRQANCATGAFLGEAEKTSPAGGSSLTYDPDADQYVYVWKTEKSWSGTCRRLDLQLSDGSHHFADFRLR